MSSMGTRERPTEHNPAEPVVNTALQGESQRERALDRAFTLESMDHVLVAPFSEHFFSTRQVGLSNERAMRDHAARFTAMKESVLRFGFDLAPASGVYPAQAYAAIGADYFQWPGDGLPPDRPFQFVEREYLLAEEYDAFLANPDDFTLRVLWPRMAQHLDPLSGWAPLRGLGPDPIFFGGNLASEESLRLLDHLRELGEATRDWQHAEVAYSDEMRALGYPLAYGANFTPPFDLVADYLRGLRGVMLDMYRNPGKLLAAVEVYIEPQIEAALAWAEALGNPRVVIWLHRGAAGFMSNEQYERFYWPSLRRVVLGLLELGLTPILHVQGDYTPRLHFLAELPRGKVPIHYDRIDRTHSAKIMGERQCFWGNVPAALLATGTPTQVREDVHDLIDMFAPFGGLIVDGNVGIPDEAAPENVMAMAETVQALR
jgi:hypothetical protein